MPNKSLITWTVQIAKRFCISDGLVRKAQLLGLLYNKGFITALALALSGAGVVGGSIQAVVSVSSVEPSITGGDETGCQEREWDTESERITRSPCGQVEPMFISVLPTLGGQVVCKLELALSTTGSGLREAGRGPVVTVLPQAIYVHK